MIRSHFPSLLSSRRKFQTYEPFHRYGRGWVYRLRAGESLTCSGPSCPRDNNLSTGTLDNLEDVADQIRVYEFDLRDYDRIAPVIAGADRVFHLGALPSVPKSILEPVPSHETNLDGTFNVLRAAVEGKAGRVIYVGSMAARQAPRALRELAACSQL